MKDEAITWCPLLVDRSLIEEDKQDVVCRMNTKEKMDERVKDRWKKDETYWTHVFMFFLGKTKFGIFVFFQFRTN